MVSVARTVFTKKINRGFSFSSWEIIPDVDGEQESKRPKGSCDFTWSSTGSIDYHAS